MIPLNLTVLLDVIILTNQNHLKAEFPFESASVFLIQTALDVSTCIPRPNFLLWCSLI